MSPSTSQTTNRPACRAQLVELARQQMTFGAMRADQRVQRVRIGGGRLSNREVGHFRVSFVASSRIVSASSTSASVTMYGGSSRMTVVAVRLIEQAALERRCDDGRRVLGEFEPGDQTGAAHVDDRARMTCLQRAQAR